MSLDVDLGDAGIMGGNWIEMNRIEVERMSWGILFGEDG